MPRLLVLFLGLALLITLSSGSSSSAVPSCTTVYSQLAPCILYVDHGHDDLKADNPSKACCKGVKDIHKLATKQDHIAVCNCIKATVIEVVYIIPSRIAEVPKKCGLPYNVPPIHKNFDCNT
ncbi:non-specific lipid-transfer protein A-like [Lycium ferocissimum]|uniref:non-specific lipid-transfer protein A-like n=1 Tax=Lycium ferocissimum TaxID=112874 RepID=UPI002815B83E|nr:non-specific lipid-transfer protein A-like [Lycium ferocissimum]